MQRRQKKFDYKKLKLTDDYDYTSNEEEDAKLKLDEETKKNLGDWKTRKRCW